MEQSQFGWSLFIPIRVHASFNLIDQYIFMVRNGVIIPIRVHASIHLLIYFHGTKGVYYYS